MPTDDPPSRSEPQSPADRLEAAAWKQLAADLNGHLARPGESGYHPGLPWGMCSGTPAAVVAAKSPHDIALTVQWAARHGLRVMVRCTGQASATVVEDTMIVDTTGLSGIRIDAAARTATIGAGALWGEVVGAAALHGLAPVCGSALQTGVVGFLTGGGIGPLSRSLGVSSDRVRALDVVTGDGQLRRVTPTEHPDLFWGFRGGKGTLGIVVSVVIDLVKLVWFYGGTLYFGARDIATTLHRWREWARNLPEEGTTSACILQLPAPTENPEAAKGEMTLALRWVWLGELSVGQRLADELVGTAAPVGGAFEIRPMTQIGAVNAEPLALQQSREEGCLLDDLTDETLDALLELTGPGSISSLYAVEILQLGGRVSDPPAHPDAFDGRDASWNLMLRGGPAGDNAELAEELKAVMTRVRPWSTGLTMPNLRTTDDPGALHRLYAPATLRRLSELVDAYDPHHVLHAGQLARNAVELVEQLDHP